eukprot:CAMPEP_0202874436 /NCGR_PEP_ID=MMETSP1391-20130828/25428_1 /ASSEMBLY_ACC=CAM_ASM_000867 /TAXON_ID=1034604 /ORGANISM="Chlamydomonas leiostraca, Strain SAG 11-49" /LENGTH=35 /DNA_ID= /DNA_START= /DNA_END= /DNA_ORIENTATION=
MSRVIASLASLFTSPCMADHAWGHPSLSAFLASLL